MAPKLACAQVKIPNWGAPQAFRLRNFPNIVITRAVRSWPLLGEKSIISWLESSTFLLSVSAKREGARSAAMTRALTVKQPSIERLAHRMAVTLTSLERLSLFLLCVCVCDGKLPSLLSAGTKLHCRGINVEKHARATSDT